MKSELSIIYEGGASIKIKVDLDKAIIKSKIESAILKETIAFFIDSEARGVKRDDGTTVRESEIAVFPHKALMIVIIAISDLTLIQ